jgi:hypothetical protein
VAAGAGEAVEEKVRVARRLLRVAQDEVGTLPRAGERQPDYLVAEIRVGLHDGVLGALGFFDGLAALGVGRVDGRPPRCEENRIAIAAGAPERVCIGARSASWRNLEGDLFKI